MIRLQGAALRQSVLGSDLSYEDMTEEKTTLDDYDVTLDGSETISGRDCYILTLTAKKQGRSPILSRKSGWTKKDLPDVER